jgi:hypothetical protein
LRADGEAKAIHAVFDAIHRGNPDQKLLSYQYLQMLPEIARGDANKVWIVPSEIGAALEGLGAAVGRFGAASVGGPPTAGATAADGPATEDLAEVQAAADEAVQETEAAVSAAHAEVREALEAAQQASAVSEPPLRRE